jgi:ubiquinone/menaquinone biosynthesis C-methylase UbiE
MIGVSVNHENSKFKREEFERIDYFKRQGLKNPCRVRRLIEDAIKLHNLDLTDLVVFTEAASKNYVVTPIIAAMAGAKVYAITSDSPYGRAKDVEDFTYNFAEFCDVRDKIEVVFEKKKEIISQANIVTNLGFVRPINKNFVEMMNEKAVIPYMCEAWENREGDIDIKACNSKNIPVMATNEDAPGLEVFDFSGNLCIKMLFELEIEVYKSKIVVVSEDKFGKVIEKHLRAIGADVYLIENLKSEMNRRYLKDSDALVIAGYINNDVFVGAEGAQISAKELVELSRKISVIQFAGDVDIDELDKFDIPYFPQKRIGKFRMGMTLAELGPKPVIDLHCAGLKVGEVMARARQSGKSVEEAKALAFKHSPAQDFSLGQKSQTHALEEYDKSSFEQRARIVRNIYEMRDTKEICATSPDFNLRELEIDFIIDSIRENVTNQTTLKILDIGCGNGYTDIRIAKVLKAKIIGVDFSPEMIRGAEHLRERFKDDLISNPIFKIGDVRKLNWNDGYFDIVISERCLLNLPSRKIQYDVIREVRRVLKKGDLYIMVEGTRNGLRRLNELRLKVGLEPIPDRSEDNISSLKFDEEEIEGFLTNYFKIIRKQHFGMYYLISRVVHPLLVSPNQPKYDAEINEVARRIALHEPDYKKIGHIVGYVLKAI